MREAANHILLRTFPISLGLYKFEPSLYNSTQIGPFNFHTYSTKLKCSNVHAEEVHIVKEGSCYLGMGHACLAPRYMDSLLYDALNLYSLSVIYFKGCTSVLCFCINR